MAKIKEIWCMHHSHLDIGYTHPQPMLMALQGDYIEQAIELCEKTRDWPEESRFTWTCEAFYPVVKWMEHAEKEKVKKFKELIREKRISIAALPMHTTPCSTEVQLLSMLKNLDALRKEFGAPMDVAINHDINGQPWPIAQAMLDSGINFYMTGINIHFGGIPFQRPSAFRWRTPDGRELLSYVGEHYSLFSQFFHTYESDTAVMHREIERYAKRLEAQGHPWDFAFLTATNPPLFDNNCPDAGLADLIRRYNAEGHEYRVRFATPEMLREKLLSMGMDAFPVWEGDWTDYWNFGAASAARETRVNKLALRTLESAGVLECMTKERDSRYQAIRREAEEQALLYNEHTWGASQAISDPDDFESQSQYIHKMETAYRAADLSGYLAAAQMEKMSGNPAQTEELKGVALLNPTGVTQRAALRFPKEWTRKERQLSARRAKFYVPYLHNEEEKPYFAHMEMEDLGTVEIPPFTWQVFPFAELENAVQEKEAVFMDGNHLETPYYTVTLNPDTGRICQLYHKESGRELMDASSEWSFFELVRETIDPRQHPENRRTLFPRDVDLCNENISMWNHGWKARRAGAEEVLDWKAEITGTKAVLMWKIQMPGMKAVEQQAIFYGDSSAIDLKVKFHKLPVHKPEGIYLAFPLKLSRDWKCGYTTAGQLVMLDAEQLGQMCRDYVSVDNGIALSDGEICMGLASPDAPMIQVGGFHFGKELRAVERMENPLLLAWPLNNYWDTNFVSGQSGAMEFSYRFFLQDGFVRTAVYRELVKGENRCLAGAAAKIGVQKRTLLESSREGVVTAVYPAKEGKNRMIALLRNQELDEQELTITIPEWKTMKVFSVNVQEQPGEQLHCRGNTVSLTLSGRERRLLLFEMEPEMCINQEVEES